MFSVNRHDTAGLYWMILLTQLYLSLLDLIVLIKLIRRQIDCIALNVRVDFSNQVWLLSIAVKHKQNSSCLPLFHPPPLTKVN